MNARTCYRVARSLDGTPLWIEPYALKAMLDAIGPRLGLERLAGEDDDEPGEPFSAKKRKAERDRLALLIEAETVEVGGGLCEYARTPEGVAVIPVLGPLVNRYDWFVAMCGWSSYDALGAAVKAAVADPMAKAILLDVDSPGGEAAGMLDCADIIREAAAVKPTWAVANTLAASAAFGLAAAAKRLTLPRLATVGSVGVVGIHLDQSGYDKEMGLKYTPIYSGARKIDGWGHAPLTKEAKDRFQAAFDESRRKFAEAVGKFRGLSTEAVLETEAGVYDDDAAVEIGFADAVQSFEATLKELTEQVRSGGPYTRAVLTVQSQLKETNMSKGKPATASAAAETKDNEKEKPESETKDEAKKDGDKPEPKDDEKQDKAAKSEKAKAADPAEVAEYCVKNGAASMAAELIREGATMDEVRERVGAAAQIRKMVADAGKVNAAIKPGLADKYIEKGMSVEDVRKALFDKLLAEQSEEIRSSNGIDVSGDEAASWAKAIEKANAQLGLVPKK